ncbi:hypothetical protein D3C84_380670 [compost metagenome]
MGEVAHDADAVHLGDDLAAEAGKPAIALVAAGAHQVLGVVAHLHDAHAELLEHLDVADLVLERVGVLEAEEDAGLAQLLGLADVGGGAHRDHQVAVIADQLVAGGDVVHRRLEAFPDRHRAVGRGQAALAHVFEEFTVPLGNDQTVDDDAVGVQFGWAHQAVPCYPCAESSAGALGGAYPWGIRRYRAKATGVLPKASSRSRMGKPGSEVPFSRGPLGWIATCRSEFIRERAAQRPLSAGGRPAACIAIEIAPTVLAPAGRPPTAGPCVSMRVPEPPIKKERAPFPRCVASGRFQDARRRSGATSERRGWQAPRMPWTSARRRPPGRKHGHQQGHASVTWRVRRSRDLRTTACPRRP